ncbi:hypothetical protein E3J79_03560 [Candidatus Dependentiae bacterium]|nr:MAG: hypothetical protein E3J79_03560 [Candidatus Dependentiae bacterium]
MVGMKAVMCQMFLFFLCLGIYQQTNALSSYSKNDPYPVFTSLDPHLFLQRNEILKLIGERPESTEANRFGFSLSPFFQKADYGKVPRNLGCATYDCATTGCSETGGNQCTSVCTELGDLEGRWSLIPLLFGKLPEGVSSFVPTLEVARQQLFPNDPPGTINYPQYIDPNKECGFISFPGTYKKRGLRGEVDIRLIDGFGIKLQSGFADMCLTVSPKLYCDCTDTNCNCLEGLDPDKVKKYLVCKYREIARELCLDTDPFHECYIEDIWASLYWRKAYELTEHPDCPHRVLAIPFFVVGGAFAVGKRKDPCKPFSLPFGNNGHHAVGITAGLDFNFVESIEIGAEFGLTHFFSRDVNCLRVPNSIYQSGIYPFWTNATVSPGHNCHFGAKLATYHFLGCLSVYFQYIYLSHQDDEIKLKKCDSAFTPGALKRFSSWNVQLANAGFNYDISSNLSLGILWQIPITQCNTYKSTTVLVSLCALF